MRLERRYEAEAAHQLTAGVPEGHPCRRLHGHRYVITVTIVGDVDPSTGMLLEYAEIDRRVNEALFYVDHRFLNDLGGPEQAMPLRDQFGRDMGTVALPVKEPELAAKVRQNSTVENLVTWFIAELKHRFPRTDTQVGVLSFLSPQVYAVRIEEDSRSAVEV
jgi:6-pyruvoyl-tetrahydropterin synthase